MALIHPAVGPPGIKISPLSLEVWAGVWGLGFGVSFGVSAGIWDFGWGLGFYFNICGQHGKNYRICIITIA